MSKTKRKPEDQPDDALRSDRFTDSLPVVFSAICLLLAVSGITYLLWDFDAAPKRFVETSQITVTIPGQPSQVVAARTRSVAERGGQPMADSQQVQLPDGQWIDCRQDCEATLRGRL